MEKFIIGCIVYACIILSPSSSLGLEADGSYSNTDGVVQVAAQGKHWLNSSIRINGRYNKVEGSEDRFAYGILSRYHAYGVVIESSGNVYDTHQSASNSIGFGSKRVTVSFGMHVDWPNSAPREELGLIIVRLTRLDWEVGHDKNLTLEGSYSYLSDGDIDRHDYKAESRINHKHVYVGARYSHTRDVVVQSAFVGLKF